MVIEDSVIGLKAALGARMNCVITYTDSTKNQVSSILLNRYRAAPPFQRQIAWN